MSYTKKYSFQYLPKETRLILFLVLLFGIVFSILSPSIFGLTGSAIGIILMLSSLAFSLWYIPLKFCNEVEITFGAEGLDTRLLRKAWLGRDIFQGHQNYENVISIRNREHNTHKGGFSILKINFLDGARLEFQSNTLIDIFHGIELKAIADHLVAEMQARDITINLEG